MPRHLAVAARLFAMFAACHLSCVHAADAPVAPPLRDLQQIDWTLHLPQQEVVEFHGVVDSNAGGASGTMMYPAPSMIGFLAAIATHVAIGAATRDHAETVRLEAADKVLLPYRDILKAYSYKDLMHQALDWTTAGRARQLVGGADQTSAGWIVDSAPTFALTQDQSALVLENTVLIHLAGGASYQNTVRVVSHPQSQPDLTAYWSAAEGKQLKEQSARLLALSLDIAWKQAASLAADTAAFKTVRYQQGRADMVERAQLLDEACGRSLIKNLRGQLMSVPMRAGAVDDAQRCDRI